MTQFKPANLAVLAIALLAVTAASCGEGGRLQAGASAEVTAGPQDLGGTVTLRSGETLRLSPSGPQGRWILTSYPRDILRLETEKRATDTFVFVATAEGSGTIRAQFAVKCPPPLLEVEAAVPCPVGGPNEDQAAAPLPQRFMRIFILHVTVG
jgi:hypothetical protein